MTTSDQRRAKPKRMTVVQRRIAANIIAGNPNLFNGARGQSQYGGWMTAYVAMGRAGWVDLDTCGLTRAGLAEYERGSK